MAFDFDSERLRQEERSKHSQFLEDQALDDLKWVMNDPRGRRFIASVIDLTCLDRSSSLDENAMLMAFKEGCRWVGVQLRRRVERDFFNQYIEMLREINEWQTKH